MKHIILFLFVLTATAVFAQDRAQDRSVALVFPTGHPQFSNRARGAILKAARKNKIDVKDYRIRDVKPAILNQHDAILLMLSPVDMNKPGITALLKAESKSGKNGADVLIWHLSKSKAKEAEVSVDVISTATIKREASPAIKKHIIPFILGPSS